jgi:hypothetical protein
VLFRAYHIPYTAYAADDGGYVVNYDELIAGVQEEATEYLNKKVADMKNLGVVRVAAVTKEGFSGDEIIALDARLPMP